ncbi:MAG: ribosomal-protein-alanine N-acetyltransferase [Patiriisocius sp.]|jgi:RimJ/RimL family protein N-acetyltransferase
MKDTFNVGVREIQLKDIDLIADYWLKSDDDFLVNMGVDLNKLPTRNAIIAMLKEQNSHAIPDKKSYALIWELDGKQIGHSSVNRIVLGKEATMHLHLWKSVNSKKGIGTELVTRSLPFYFKNIAIKKLICEPYALNAAPNRTLASVGFNFIKKYSTIPGASNFEQEVNRWELTKDNFEKKHTAKH